MNPILREARSSPYIGMQPEENNSNNNGNEGIGVENGHNKMNNAVSDERFGKPKEAFESVLFNAGSSSSSTDLQFYSDSLGNMETLKEWAKLHEKQRHSTDAPALEHHQQRRMGERCTAKAESAENLAESGEDHSSEQISMMGMECGECAGSTEGSNFLGKHRSETNLPGKAAKDGGFRLLEKCSSVELSPAKFMVPPSRLARSKEMPNIADVDDLESCDL